ncbi:MAG: hypothetical protein E6J90_19440 [Deltaproteobacteria bacterium]|nr:MAG: hypothetical protein E6J90_19440 [Deltaproteobacteria bacterium]
MKPHPISTYAAIGMICGGTAGVVQAVANGSSILLALALLLASLSGAIVGASYGYLKLRHAARRADGRR